MVRVSNPCNRSVKHQRRHRQMSILLLRRNQSRLHSQSSRCQRLSRSNKLLPRNQSSQQQFRNPLPHHRRCQRLSRFSQLPLRSLCRPLSPQDFSRWLNPVGICSR